MPVEDTPQPTRPRLLERVPGERFLRDGADVPGQDAPVAEGLHEGGAVAEAIVRHEVEVGRDQRPQIFAEGDVDRRAIVERADADVEDVGRRLAGVRRQAVDEVGVQGALGEDAGAARGETDQIAGPPGHDGEEGLVDGEDQDRAAVVHLLRVGVAERPHGRVDIVAQRPAAADAFAELLRQAPEEPGRRQVAPGPGDLESHQLGHGEMLEQGHDVGEGLVEGRDVRVRGLLEAAMQAVQQGMGHLVGDDVGGQAGEHHGARRRGVPVPRARREIAEQQGLLVGAVIGIVGSERVRIDPEAPDLVGLLRAVLGSGVDPGIARRPQGPAAERLLEMADRRHADGVDHLLMEGRIALGRRPAVLRQDGLVVEVDRVVDLVRGRVDVDDLEILADRPGPQRLVPDRNVVPRHPQHRLVHGHRGQTLGHARVEGVDAQPAVRRGRPLDLALDCWLGGRRGPGGRGGLPAQEPLEHGPQGP